MDRKQIRNWVKNGAGKTGVEMTSRCSEAEDVANEFSYYNITKELEKQIFNTIKSLRNSKK